jgi:arginyl-tRNA synthetase
VYDLAKVYNTFYNELSILKEADAKKLTFRVSLCTATAATIHASMKMLGIAVPERM